MKFIQQLVAAYRDVASFQNKESNIDYEVYLRRAKYLRNKQIRAALKQNSKYKKTAKLKLKQDVSCH